MPKVGVVLSGCGVFDGAEIHEAVLTLYFLQKNGAETICMAPDIEQLHVVDHLRGEVASGEKRNVLTESARIARGNIKNLADVKVSDFDALIFPGGFGAAKNLTDFALKGSDCGINSDVLRIVRETVLAKKTSGCGVHCPGGNSQSPCGNRDKNIRDHRGRCRHGSGCGSAGNSPCELPCEGLCSG
ncbi:MAG: isoprenoid biosynthesis glyoxalase ElbB [Geovibrio sp.]|nr:isoprenoid biosynthesis glyoxalase ElbB [Geovibrio sp.]